MSKTWVMALLPSSSRSHKMLPSTLYIMSPKHLLNLMLLHLTVQENMHLQESTLFDLDLRVTQNVALSTLHSMWPMHLPSQMIIVIMSNGLGGYQENTLFDLDLKVTHNVAKYTLHHVTYAATKFEVAYTTNGSGARRYNYKKPHAHMDRLTLVQKFFLKKKKHV